MPAPRRCRSRAGHGAEVGLGGPTVAGFSWLRRFRRAACARAAHRARRRPPGSRTPRTVGAAPAAPVRRSGAGCATAARSGRARPAAGGSAISALRERSSRCGRLRWRREVGMAANWKLLTLRCRRRAPSRPISGNCPFCDGAPFLQYLCVSDSTFAMFSPARRGTVHGTLPNRCDALAALGVLRAAVAMLVDARHFLPDRPGVAWRPRDAECYREGGQGPFETLTFIAIAAAARGVGTVRYSQALRSSR